MLEQQRLLIRDWPPADEEPASIRHAVVDPATGSSLGCVRRQAPSPAWLRWLFSPLLAIYETDDESLLFTLRRSWRFGSHWLVRDADENHVGAIRPPALHERLGRWIGTVKPSAIENVMVIGGTSGQELARLQRSGSDLLVAFGSALEQEPFLKMLMLAGSLAQPRDSRRT